MGKRASQLALVASRAASVQKVLNRLALSNKRVQRALQLSLLLTKALVASPGRRNYHSNNTTNVSTAKLTPQRALLLHLVRPCLELAPWIYSLVFLVRLPFSLSLSLSPLPSFTHAMASYANSNTSTPSASDISTPRSISPSSSVASARFSQSSISTSKRMSISSTRRISAANPMSSVDISAIEEAMRTASLDTLRGYAQNRYSNEVRQYATTEYLSQSQALGYQVLSEPMWNKGESACRAPSLVTSIIFLQVLGSVLESRACFPLFVPSFSLNRHRTPPHKHTLYTSDFLPRPLLVSPISTLPTSPSPPFIPSSSISTLFTLRNTPSLHHGVLIPSSASAARAGG